MKVVALLLMVRGNLIGMVSVPFGNNPKLDGTYAQRQGKNMGLDMMMIHALKQDLKTAYGGNTDFSDGSPYFVKSDNDDTYTIEFETLVVGQSYHVVPFDASLSRPFVEPWKVVPDGEMNNPVSEIVTWYQKTIHDSVGKPLSPNYVYDGYEIWEDNTKNPVSKAPRKITITAGNNILMPINLKFAVNSPIEGNHFYNLYKNNDNDDQRDFVVSTKKLEIGIDRMINPELLTQMQANDSKFDLVLGHSTWNPTYVVHPLTFENGAFTGNMSFNLDSINPGPVLHTFISYRRTPRSEPVIITGTDFWLSSNIEALKCLEYHNQSEARSLRKNDFAINELSRKNYIDEFKYLNQGYTLSKYNEEYTIMKGETLTFSMWDNVYFAF